MLQSLREHSPPSNPTNEERPYIQMPTISQIDITRLARLTRDYNVAPIFLPNEVSISPAGPVATLFGTLTLAIANELRMGTTERLDSFIENLQPINRFMLEHIDPMDHQMRAERAAEQYIIQRVSPEHFSI